MVMVALSQPVMYTGLLFGSERHHALPVIEPSGKPVL